jgi:hypothetical protein
VIVHNFSDEFALYDCACNGYTQSKEAMYVACGDKIIVDKMGRGEGNNTLAHRLRFGTKE